MGGVGILGLAGLRAAHFGQDQDIARAQMRVTTAQRGACRPFGKTAFTRSPGIEMQLIVGAEERDIVHQLEHFRTCGESALVCSLLEVKSAAVDR